MTAAQWAETWPVLVSFALGAGLGAQWAWGVATHRGWRKGFEDHKGIVVKVWGADPMGWVDYAKERQAVLQHKGAARPEGTEDT